MRPSSSSMCVWKARFDPDCCTTQHCLCCPLDHASPCDAGIPVGTCCVPKLPNMDVCAGCVAPNNELPPNALLAAGAGVPPNSDGVEAAAEEQHGR